MLKKNYGGIIDSGLTRTQKLSCVPTFSYILAKLATSRCEIHEVSSLRIRSLQNES